MTGAIIGDIAGSRFEFRNHKSKDFELFTRDDRFTDDTVMTLAVADALESTDNFDDEDKLREEVVRTMVRYGRHNMNAGYGGSFKRWLKSNDHIPYNSFGNGAAMRISPVGWVGKDLDEVKKLSRIVTEVSHNHPEGIKAAEAVSTTIFLANNNASMDQLKRYVNTYYDIDFTLDEIRPRYKFDVSCQGSVPQAFEAFFESNSYEDAIRNAISIGGDSDTIAAITGGIAEAYYGVPETLREHLSDYLDDYKLNVINRFEKKFGDKVI